MLQDPRIAALDARRHSPADVRKRLMPVQSAQLMAAVRPKPRGSELGLPKADPRAALISRIRPHQYFIQLRIFQISKLNAAQRFNL